MPLTNKYALNIEHCWKKETVSIAAFKTSVLKCHERVWIKFYVIQSEMINGSVCIFGEWKLIASLSLTHMFWTFVSFSSQKRFCNRISHVWFCRCFASYWQHMFCVYVVSTKCKNYSTTQQRKTNTVPIKWLRYSCAHFVTDELETFFIFQC